MCLSKRLSHYLHSLSLCFLSPSYMKKIQALYEAENLVKASAPLECSNVNSGDNYKQLPTIHAIFSVVVLWLQGLTCTGISSSAVEKGSLDVQLQLPKHTELRFEEGSEWHHIRLKWKVCYSITDFILSLEYPSSPRLWTAWMLSGEKRCIISKWGDLYSENNIKLMFLSCKTRPEWHDHKKKKNTNKTTPNKYKASSHLCSNQKRVLPTTIPSEPLLKNCHWKQHREVACRNTNIYSSNWKV